MKKLLTLILLLCATLTHVQGKSIDTWKEIDTLIAHGHYTSAYNKGEQLLKRATRKKDGHAMLKATYKQCIAAAFYLEESHENAIKAYKAIIPQLKGADRSIAYILLGTTYQDYLNNNLWKIRRNLPTDHPDDDISTWSQETFSANIRACYEEALNEREGLISCPAEEYDLLIKGDASSLHLRPTLYDVVVHAVTDNITRPDDEAKIFLTAQRELLLGTADEFLQAPLSSSTTSHTLWQLKQLQDLTAYHHTRTKSTIASAHIDYKRMQGLKTLMNYTEGFDEAYTSGLERIAQSYSKHPTEEAKFLYMLALHHLPEVSTHDNDDAIAQGAKQGEKMEQYIQRIKEIAPQSEWAKLGESLYQYATSPYLRLQEHTTLLPERADSIMITLLNMTGITYRIVPRYVNESIEEFDYDEVTSRQSVGEPYYKKLLHPSSPYTYEKASLALPPLAAGDYFVIATNDCAEKESKRTSITTISVSNIKLSMIPDQAEGIYIGMAIDATTGKAINQCEATLMEKDSKNTHLIGKYLPNKEGYFTIPFPTGRYRNLYLRVSDGISYATYNFKYADFLGNTYTANESGTLFTFLPDRYTYQPGDTIQFNLIAYTHEEEGSRVLAHRPINISLKDTKSKEACTLQGTTDEWGCFSSTIAIPEDITPGSFSLQATDNTNDHSTYHTINIEAFKAPSFTASIEHPTGTICFGDSVALQGAATTFTGLPVGQAKVQYEVTASHRHIFRYYLPQNTSAHTIAGTTTTDEKGHFCIPLKVSHPTDLNENATQTYSITAHITDITGETQTTYTSFIVGYRTKYVQFEEIGTVRLHGDHIGFSLYTLNGEPIGEQVHVRLSKLKAPQTTGISSSEEGENAQKEWTEERIVSDFTIQTSIKKTNHITLTKDMPCGTYRMTVTYNDKGKQYSDIQHFTLWGEGKGATTSKAIYTLGQRNHEVLTGDTAVLYIGTRHRSIYIHYYISVEDRIVGKGTLPLDDEATMLRIPIEPTWRNQMSVHMASVKENVKRISTSSFTITNRTEQLQAHLSTFRNYLQPGDTEQCTISISDYTGHPMPSALTLSIYDSALDTYGKNYWDITLAPTKYARRIAIEEPAQWAWENNPYVKMSHPTQPHYYSLPEASEGNSILYSIAAPMTLRGRAKNRAELQMDASAETMALQEGAIADEEKISPSAPDIEVRKNLRHTALFIPALRTDEQGIATFRFTAPDRLTLWHVKGFVHTRDLKHGHIESSFITRKALMVRPYAPRFLYEGDTCRFAVKVSNTSDITLTTKVRIEWLDKEGHTLSIGQEGEQAIVLAPGESQSIESLIAVPRGTNELTYRTTAYSPQHSDGEQGQITILQRRTLVTETTALYINGNEKREHTFDALALNRSTTLQHQNLTLEIVSNPIWYAIEALPPMCEESNPSNEQLFHRFYAATLALKLLDLHPEIAAGAAPCALYNADSLQHVQKKLQEKLAANQHADGSWAWMEGFTSDYFTTLLIIKGLGELEQMECITIAGNPALYNMVKLGIEYLDRALCNEYEQSKQKSKPLSSHARYYLYARSMFPEIPFTSNTDKAYRHYKQLLVKEKSTQGTLMQKALKMLTLIEINEWSKAKAVAENVKQSSLSSDEMGIYWRDNKYTYAWDSDPIATQALLIEAFAQLHQPEDIISRMQQWLLKQKQTTRWDNNIATAQAIHALIASYRGEFLSTSANAEVKAKNATLTTDNVDHRGTTQYDVMPKMERNGADYPTISIQLRGKEESHPVWGTLTWQYYEEVDKVRASSSGLALMQTYYKIVASPQGETLVRIEEGIPVKQGDRIRVRMQFTSDRTMDYIELRIPRPAALEPTNTHSGYCYSHGIGHYRSVENTQDIAYIPRIDKGKYILEFDYWASQSGVFTCKPSTICSMYAPTFAATTESQVLEVRE